MLVALVDVASRRVRLPDLDELTGHGAAVAVEDPAGHADALADRLPAVLDGEVGFEDADVAVAEGRGVEFDRLRVGVAQVLRRVAQER